MKALTFKTTSWHYLLATKLAHYCPRTESGEYGNDNPDICTYARHVIGGLMLLILIGICIAGLGYAVFDIALAIVFSLYYHVWLGDAMTTVSTMIVLICIVVVAFHRMCNLISEYRRNKLHYDTNGKYIRNPVIADGFIIQAYKSWKGKFCVPIKFMNKNE